MATRLSPACLQVVELQDTSTAQELMEGMLGGPASWLSLLHARTCCWHRLAGCTEPRRPTHTHKFHLAPTTACLCRHVAHAPASSPGELLWDSLASLPCPQAVPLPAMHMEAATR